MSGAALRKPLAAVVMALVLCACGGGGNGDSPGGVGPPAAPAYYVGFTPLPYDIDSIDAVLDYVYGRIAADANIILHHFDDGIQWDKALSGEAFHPDITDDWQLRRDRTPAGHKVFVAVTPLNFWRNGLAAYRSDAANQPLPSPWDTYALNHSDVKTAYLNYCRRIIDFFQPDYFAVGIEVNLLMLNAKPSWTAFVELHRHVYAQLKADYPSLPIFVSYTGMDFVSGWTSANHADQMTALADTIGYTDYFGLSIHPQGSVFMLNRNPAAVPTVEDFRTLFALGGKPVAVCETSYPAEPFTAYGGWVATFGTPELQWQFFQNLLAAADQTDTEFIINFVLRDYDALWQDMGSPDDIIKFWRDTGFYDENGKARPVWTIWREKLP
jgi:hypothetical protein